MEQYVRDARINMIYEGTNTIQSLDLLGRKVLMDNGAKLRKFGALVQAFVEENGTDEAMSEFVTPLADLGDKVHQADHGNRHEGVPEPGRGRRRRGRTTCAWSAIWSSPTSSARMAKIALAKLDADGFDKAKLARRFYRAKLLPTARILISPAPAAGDRLARIRCLARSGAKNPACESRGRDWF